MTLQDMVARFDGGQRELSAIMGRGDTATTDDLGRAETLVSELETLKQQIETQRALQGRVQALTAWAGTPANRIPLGSNQPIGGILSDGTGMPAALPGASTQYAVPRRNKSRSFKGDARCSGEERAYRFGRFLFAGLFNHGDSLKFCRANGIPLIRVSDTDTVNLAHDEVVAQSGAVLVPVEFDNELIDLRESFGVFRQWARVKPMRSDVLIAPRRTGGLTAYAVGDNVAITESTKAWDNVTLTARKIGVLAKYSSELNEDAMIDLGDDLAQEAAYAFASLEDDCGFNGDGTSTYIQVVGLARSFLNLGSTANIAGLVTGTGTAWSGLVLSDFQNLTGRLPAYAFNGDPAFYCSNQFFQTIMVKLMLAAGGVTAAEIASGAAQNSFMGYPVRKAQKMPTASASTHIPVYFGSLRLAAYFGDRRQTTIAMSEHAGFANDQLQVRATERFDVNVHDVGNASATAALRVAGPIVALYTG